MTYRYLYRYRNYSQRVTTNDIIYYFLSSCDNIIGGCSAESARTVRSVRTYTVRTPRNARAAAITRRVGIDRQKVRKGRWLELVGQRRRSLAFSFYILRTALCNKTRTTDRPFCALRNAIHLYFIFFFYYYFYFLFSDPTNHTSGPSRRQFIISLGTTTTTTTTTATIILYYYFRLQLCDEILLPHHSRVTARRVVPLSFLETECVWGWFIFAQL